MLSTLHCGITFQSRAKHEDPEQAKLKEKAKAVSRCCMAV